MISDTVDVVQIDGFPAVDQLVFFLQIFFQVTVSHSEGTDIQPHEICSLKLIGPYAGYLTGKEVFYITDKPKLKIEGHGSCHSEGWLVAYDWDTKQEVSREQISFDSYVAGMNVYWRGVHDEKGRVVDMEAMKAEEKGT